MALKRHDTYGPTYKTDETHRLRERAYGCRWEGTVREFRTDVHVLLHLKSETNRTYCAAWETLLTVMWWPRGVGSLGESRHVYMYG